eukprot:m.1110105 g.1110105  ORF g.1110105 m.1110105 type:complete len:761 (-) comp24356_c0_seq8:2995-5277(-)
MRCVTVATCQLNQWALDFGGNKSRILESIQHAKSSGAQYRLGPELEICGYGCNDHFLEADTFEHSLEVLRDLLEDDICQDIICDVGMPYVYNGVRYNCRVLFYNKRILLIRPKLFLAMDGNYREGRWFSRWMHRRTQVTATLPQILREATGGQTSAPFGDVYISLLDTSIAVETCEELFTPNSPHIEQSLNGVEIFTNGSGSHHELRKLDTRLQLVMSATQKVGGVYLYANQQGCDGERVYYDGCAMIVLNGKVLAQASQFSLRDVEVITATVDLDSVVTYRASIMSRSAQAAETVLCPRIDVDVGITDRFGLCTPSQPARIHSPAEEIALGPACWLWDYLRRTGLTGYFLPLSGGIDSTATACIVASMCRLVFNAAREGNDTVLADLRRITGNGDDYVPESAQEIAHKVFHTAYLGTVNSSAETRARSAAIAAEIGAYHIDLDIDAGVQAITSIFTTCTGHHPQFKALGGSHQEDIALQNIQARLRMLLSYLFAQLLPWTRGVTGRGGLLVLGSANVDEALRGYLTKYDCSAADVNPIGGISKTDLRMFIGYCMTSFNFPSLGGILAAPPTAELQPLVDGANAQTDEDDMGMTYDELSIYGRLRKISKCGPVGMFRTLAQQWHHLSLAEVLLYVASGACWFLFNFESSDTRHPITHLQCGGTRATHVRSWQNRSRYACRCGPQVGTKVKFFFRMYAINRHKTTVLTPAYHAENYTPDDNRFDLRPFLYNATWQWQFDSIDREIVQRQALPRTAPMPPKL